MFRKADEAVSEAAVVGEDSSDSDAMAQPWSVLVIDDDPDVRNFIASSLEEQGYKVSEASDGHEGLAAIERAAPDLVIVDFIMPGMTGAEVARKIRSRLPDQPILFVSGYSE